jgi:predicted transposase/invertase (TIGR01784 family)
MNIDSATEKYINPFTDFGFKKLFGTEVNKDLLIDFLNELINGMGTITEVKYLNSEQLGRTEYDRKAVFDIFCQTDTGENFIVEMQKSKHNFFKERSVFYASFPIRDQAEKGDWNYDLKAVYMVGVLDFIFDEDKNNSNYYYTEVKLMDVEKKTIFYDKLTFIYLEMPKFNKTLDELESRFDKWMYLLKHLPRLQGLPPKLRERVFEKMCRVAEIAKMTKAEMSEYENSLKVYRDWYSTLTTAKEEGRAEVLIEGRAEGLAEGREEKARETAINLLNYGVSIAIISKSAGLSVEQIEQLIKEMQ